MEKIKKWFERRPVNGEIIVLPPYDLLGEYVDEITERLEQLEYKLNQDL